MRGQLRESRPRSAEAVEFGVVGTKVHRSLCTAHSKKYKVTVFK